MEEEPDTHPAEAAFILARLARSDSAGGSGSDRPSAAISGRRVRT